MRRIINRLRQARRDIEACYLYIGRDNFNAAEHFLDTLDNLFDTLAANPAVGRKRVLPRAGDIYIFPVSAPFNEYLVFYRATAETLEVLRLIHGKRWTEVEGFLNA